MGIKYDAERLLDDLSDIIKSNLNTKIEEIQTEKQSLLGASNFDVPSIDDRAYFTTLDERVVNFNPYVYYGIGDNAVIEIETAESSEISAFFTVVFASDGTEKSYKQALRYVRALQEIVTENFCKIPEASNFKVGVIVPADLRDQDGTEETYHKIAGITLQTAIS